MLRATSLLAAPLILLAGAACSPGTEVDDPCEGVDCSGRGACEVVDGGAVCVCDERFAGEDCGECAEGYRPVGADCVRESGPCEPDPCDRSPCPAGASCVCDERTGEPVCACEPDPCEPSPCVRGSCRTAPGTCEPACDCDEGWTGDLCDGCAESYLPEGGECVPCNLLTFAFFDASATTVWLTGTFTSWAETPADGAIPMESDGAGRFAVTVAITPGGRHLYKLIVDGSRWEHDPDNPERVDDELGGWNSVLDVCDFGGGCGDPDEFDWRDTVMYFVMIDRFRDGDGLVDPVPGATGGPPDGPSGQFMGGDLRGVTDGIDYLAGLGVTAIWLSAPYANRSLAGAAIDPAADPHMYSGYHGYWPSPEDIDYSDPSSPVPRPAVEPRIGTEDDLRGFVETAQATVGANGHGLRVLFDYVMNHVDSESGLYRARTGSDWFAYRAGSFALCGPEDLWDDPYWGTRCAFTDYLPPFDFDRPGPRRWSVADALWWASELGIDGYRLDAIKHVPFSWLTDLRAAISESISAVTGQRFYLVGETFAYDDRDLLRSFVDPETMLDGQFDFPFKARLCEAVFHADGRLDDFAGWMDGNDGFYGAGSIMTTWIGNHDIPRAIHFASREIGNCREGSSPANGWTSSYRQPADAAPYERLGVAFAVMMTSPGIPLIYYGDEIGLAGGGDPDNRRMMVWDDGDLSPHQRALRDRVAALAAARGASRALSRGRRTTLSATAETWVYRMGGCGGGVRDVVVAINRADSERTVAVPVGSYLDLLTGASASGGATPLPPRSFLVLEVD